MARTARLESFSRGHHDRGLCRVAEPVPLASLRPGGREWFQQHFEGFHITAFEVVWSKHGQGQAVFLGQRSDGRKFTVSPRAARQAAEFSWDTDDIADI